MMEGSVSEPDLEPDWCALPTGVLQLIMYKASTWQGPGSCLAAPVCRSWRLAAAGCKDVRLLYFMGRAEADASFTAWLSQCSPQLGALTLSNHPNSTSATQVLQALASAAEAAQAAGAPLQLHTLRVLDSSVRMGFAGRLLACLPRLRCLQLMVVPYLDLGALSPTIQQLHTAVREALGPLQQATQLQELYLMGPMSVEVSAAVARFLPHTLKRLSWGTGSGTAPDLTHLSRLTFLRLSNWGNVISFKLPRRLQQLELWQTPALPQLLEQEVLAGWHTTSTPEAQEQLGNMPNLKRLALEMASLGTPAVCTALAQHTQSSALELFARGAHVEHMPAALAAAGSLSSLRNLKLTMLRPPLPTGLGAVRQVTKLVVSMWRDPSNKARHRAWAKKIGCMTSLQWLSLPGHVQEAGWGPLTRLQQLRVLVVHCVGSAGEAEASIGVLLEGWGQHGLPPRLQVLCVYGMTAERAATEQLRRLRQALRGSGCELVVGVDLDEVCDPAQQLAGLPVALQQVLA